MFSEKRQLNLDSIPVGVTERMLLSLASHLDLSILLTLAQEPSQIIFPLPPKSSSWLSSFCLIQHNLDWLAYFCLLLGYSFTK